MILPAAFAAYAGTLELLDRSDVHLRSTWQTGQPAVAAVDLSTQPLARLVVSDRRWEYRFFYAPTLIETYFVGPQTLLVYHFASASVGWHDRFLRIVLTEGATYGQTNSALLLQAPTPQQGSGAPPPLQPAPPPVTIQYVSSATDLAVTARLERRLSLSWGAGYTVSRQLDSVSGSLPVVPDLQDTHTSATIAWNASHRDSLATSVLARYTSTTGVAPQVCFSTATLPPAAPECAPQTINVLFIETYSHRIAARATLGVTAGVAEAWARLDPGLGWQSQAYPAGGVSLTLGSRRSTIALLSSLTPVVDARTGLLDELAQVGFALNARPMRALTFIAGATAAQSVPGLDGGISTTMVTANMGADVLLDRAVSVGVGQQAAWQSQSGFGSFFSEFTYVSLTLRASPLRF